MTSEFARCDDGTYPVSRALDALDGRWTILVVRDLLSGTKRFGSALSQATLRK